MLRTRPAVPPRPNKRRKCIEMRPPHPLLGVLALALVLPLLLLACEATAEPTALTDSDSATADPTTAGAEPSPNVTAVPPLAQTPPESDREALVALYNATDGPNWHSRDNWLSDMPIDDWHGVTTDPSGRVTELTLLPSYELLMSRYDPRRRGDATRPRRRGDTTGAGQPHQSESVASRRQPAERGRFRRSWPTSSICKR